MLKAIKPEIINEGKPKFLISGKSGVGKSIFSMSFPSVYFIDSEGGATRHQYREKLKNNGGVYLGKEQGSQDFQTVIEEIKMLATEKHQYRTLVIDSFSYLYNLAASIAESRIGSDFGRDKKEANKPTRQLIRWLENIDMTVILICHQKDKWVRDGKEIVHAGSTFDGYDKMEYILDLWIEILKDKENRSFSVRKSRIENFKEGMSYPLEYDKFAELYGKSTIEKQSTPIKLAIPEQTKWVKELVLNLNIDNETVQKWWDKAEVTSFEEMTSDTIEKIISFLEKKADKIKKEVK